MVMGSRYNDGTFGSALWVAAIRVWSSKRTKVCAKNVDVGVQETSLGNAES